MRNYIVWGGALSLGLVVACGGSSSEPPAGEAGSAGIAGSAGAIAGAPAQAGTSGDAGSGDAGGESGVSGAGGRDVGGFGGVAGFGGGEAAGSGGVAGLAGGPPIDIGPQVKSNKLDVLLVVDNSVSMSDKQGVLSASVPAFLQRLVNPRCVDAQGVPVAVQPVSGAVPCVTGTRELPPVKDLHVGVISSSIGGHGGNVCAIRDGENNDDRGELMPKVRQSLSSFANAGFSSYDPNGLTGETSVLTVISQVQAAVTAAADKGCGYEAPLEAMYRFLVDPDPPVSVDRIDGVSTPVGVNTELLAQRKAFLRPDSAVAIVVISDENDCSIRDEGVGWFVATGSQNMPRATVTCDIDPNSPCCRSCAANEGTPPAGCMPLAEDAVCKTGASPGYAAWPPAQDSLNLRCFAQQKRFGFDLLYPVERFSNALANPKIANRAGQLVDNPLFAARDGKGPRSATLISVSAIVGAPWQDLSTQASITAAQNIEYLDGAGLTSEGRWALLLGNPSANVLPSDPFMIESVTPRAGSHPLVNASISPATSTNPLQNPINGHEQTNVDFSDLQYACTFALKEPRLCENGASNCDCAPDRTGNLAGVTAANSPLCQPPAGGVPTSTQYFGKAYPGARELRLVQLLGARAVPGSICPKTLVDTASADYAYLPAFSALIGRLAATLN